jgi:hypothetical protein
MRSEGPAGRLRTAALVAVDALAYAVALAALVVVAALVVGVASGGGFVRAKVLLFLAGFGLMAYATVRLWPRTPADLESGTIPATDDETRFQRAVGALPPLRWLPPPPPQRRFTPAGKLFVGCLVVLALSYAMETVFGVS